MENSSTKNNSTIIQGPVLSERLLHVAGMVTPGRKLADIGTDHAYVPVHLVLKGVIPSALAMDIGEGPLQRAEETIRRFCLETKIQTRLSDGCRQLSPGEVSAMVAAGMGGALTEHILEDSPLVIGGLEEMILQPQSEVFRVRRWLRNHGWRILQEDMVKERGKYYPMMKAVPAVMEREETTAASEPQAPLWQEMEDIYGPVLLSERHPVLKEYLQWEKSVLLSIRSQLEKAEPDAVSSRLQEVAEKLRQNQAALERFQGTAG